MKFLERATAIGMDPLMVAWIHQQADSHTHVGCFRSDVLDAIHLKICLKITSQKQQKCIKFTAGRATVDPFFRLFLRCALSQIGRAHRAGAVGRPCPSRGRVCPSK